MRIVWSHPALNDLDAMLTALAEQSPQGLRSVKIRIDAIERLLSQFPQAGNATRLSWLRRIAINPYPYVIFYEPQDERIVIHAIRHGARNPSTMPDEDGE